MESIFIKVLNMSITASYIILLVIFVRFFIKKLPKIFSYLLWSLVFFRLLCPVSFESVWSILPQKNEVIQVKTDRLQQISSSESVYHLSVADNSFIGQKENIPFDVVTIAGFIWIIGILSIILYQFLLIIKTYKSLKCAKHLYQNIYEIPYLATPFVFGLFHPGIYMPSGLSERESLYIIEHERTHIRRGDHIFKAIFNMVLVMHWFNPFVWLSFFLMERDMELSCDESVIRRLGNVIKKEYSASLLQLSSGRHFSGTSPLAFGENNIKERIRNVLRYKKPTFLVFLIAIILILPLSIALLSNPITDETIPGITSDNMTSDKNLAVTENTVDAQTTENVLTIKSDGVYEWIIRLSGNTNTYNTPIKRYELVRVSKDGKEDILDDQLWDIGTFSEPILYTGNRFVYTAAAEDTHNSMKQPCLISIKPDGSDRKVFEAEHLVTKHLTFDNGRIYYEGWTNDSSFPRPVCSMKDDFSDHRDEAEIDGSMVTVYMDCIYYLSVDEEHPGIYSIKLNGNHEPVMYDKMGYTANEIVSESVEVVQGKYPDDHRTFANIVFIDRYYEGTIKFSTDLPLYAHEE